MFVFNDIDLLNISLTKHARERWAERGFQGEIGLKLELAKSIVLNNETAKNETDLREFLTLQGMYQFNQTGKRFYYTEWFIFVFGNLTLITCIARSRKRQRARVMPLKDIGPKRRKLTRR